jgi:hypothetical protein
MTWEQKQIFDMFRATLNNDRQLVRFINSNAEAEFSLTLITSLTMLGVEFSLGDQGLLLVADNEFNTQLFANFNMPAVMRVDETSTGHFVLVGFLLEFRLSDVIRFTPENVRSIKNGLLKLNSEFFI